MISPSRSPRSDMETMAWQGRPYQKKIVRARGDWKIKNRKQRLESMWEATRDIEPGEILLVERALVYQSTTCLIDLSIHGEIPVLELPARVLAFDWQAPGPPKGCNIQLPLWCKLEPELRPIVEATCRIRGLYGFSNGRQFWTFLSANCLAFKLLTQGCLEKGLFKKEIRTPCKKLMEEASRQLAKVANVPQDRAHEALYLSFAYMVHVGITYSPGLAYGLFPEYLETRADCRANCAVTYGSLSDVSRHRDCTDFPLHLLDVPTIRLWSIRTIRSGEEISHCHGCFCDLSPVSHRFSDLGCRCPTCMETLSKEGVTYVHEVWTTGNYPWRESSVDLLQMAGPWTASGALTRSLPSMMDKLQEESQKNNLSPYIEGFVYQNMAGHYFTGECLEPASRESVEAHALKALSQFFFGPSEPSAIRVLDLGPKMASPEDFDRVAFLVQEMASKRPGAYYFLACFALSGFPWILRSEAVQPLVDATLVAQKLNKRLRFFEKCMPPFCYSRIFLEFHGMSFLIGPSGKMVLKTDPFRTALGLAELAQAIKAEQQSPTN